jgi:large conductance mechanosensitive channel
VRFAAQTAAKLAKMSLAKEFKEFAVKGNVVDMAVGVIIGAAFGKIVTSFVTDVVTPPLGLLIGGVDFSQLTLVLRQGVGAAPPVVLKYGVFVQTVFDFLIVAMAIFAVVKMINKLKRDVPAVPAEPPRQEQLLVEIRDALRADVTKH